MYSVYFSNMASYIQYRGDYMSFYFPIFLTLVFSIAQSVFCKHGKLVYTVILAIFFTILIQIFFLSMIF